MASGSYFLLIVSDFHLSEGWDEKTKRLSRQEDFFFDTAFHRFLSKQAEIAYEQDKCLRLIFAGDMVDFQQVKHVPDEIDGNPVDRRFHGLGLSTSPAHTCYKLERIMTGHKIFFEALADFLGEGHELVVLPGNHDIEWIIPEVQGRFIKELAELGPGQDIKEIRKQVHFKPWFYLESPLVYVEHGNQYDKVDSFDYLLHPYINDNNEKLIDLPAGAFFVRYLLNHVEFSWPFADNMKPPTAFIWWALRRWQGWRNLPKYFPFFIKTLRKAGPIDTKWEEELKRTHERHLEDLALKSKVKIEVLEKLKKLWVPSAIHHLSKWSLFWALLGRAKKDAPLREVADEINQILKVKYVVFGHTHEADLSPTVSPEAEYVNSGTWSKVFAARLEERLLKEENEFAYVSIDPEQERMELLRWRDDRDEGERVRLFDPPESMKGGKTMDWCKLFVLFLLGAVLASVGDAFHVYTKTTFYPQERYIWYIKGIPFWIPILFGVASAFFGWAYVQAKRWFGARSFKEDVKLSDVAWAGLVYLAVHITSGFISHWSFPLPLFVLALPVFLVWYCLDSSVGGGIFSLFVGLIGVSAEISLVRLDVFSFSDKANGLLGVASWLPCVYISAGLAISRFLEAKLAPTGVRYARHDIYSKKPSVVYVVERKNKRECLEEAVEISGFIDHLNSAYKKSGKRQEEFCIAIKPNIMTAAYESDISVYTDVLLVEHLIEMIRREGYQDIKVVESQMVWSVFYHGRTVKDVANMLGFSCDGYDVVDLTETSKDAEKYDYGDNELGKHPAGPAWRDANYRISFAKNKTHFQCYYTGCMKNVYGCLPVQDKLKAYHGKTRKREFYSCTVIMLEKFPVDFAFLDAYFSGDGFAGLIRDPTPNETNTIICGENCLAVDWVQGEKMGLDPMKNYVVRQGVERWGKPEIKRIGPMAKYKPWKNVLPCADTIANVIEECYWISRVVCYILAYRMHGKYKMRKNITYWCTLPVRWPIKCCDFYATKILVALIVLILILIFR